AAAAARGPRTAAPGRRAHHPRAPGAPARRRRDRHAGLPGLVTRRLRLCGCNMINVIATILLSLFAPAVADDPPVFGRPSAHYYDAVGEQIHVEMSANPAELRVEQELTLAVRVTGAANPDQIRRPDLRDLDDFAARFHIDD